MEFIRPASFLAAAVPTLTPAAFISAHTIVDQTVPVNDECPICLDNYSVENCLRITGIPGCTHHIGQACLERLLSSRPDLEKKCPMCRATWVAVPSPAPRRPGRLIDLLDEAIQRRAQPSSAPHSVPLRRTPELVIIDGDSESVDFAAEVADYNRSTSDIASIRARASRTETSWTQSRQRRGVAALASGRIPSIFRPNLPESRSNFPARSSSLRQPPAAGTNLFSDDSRTERRVMFVGPRFEGSRDARAALSLYDDSPSASPSDSSPDTVAAAEPEVAELPTLNLRSSRAAELDQRKRDLDVRAAALNARELRLNERETALQARARSVMAREERAMALVQLARSQQEEREESARVHAEAMKRLMS